VLESNLAPAFLFQKAASPSVLPPRLAETQNISLFSEKVCKTAHISSVRRYA
jgi:hypothetical protein